MNIHGLKTMKVQMNQLSEENLILLNWKNIEIKCQCEIGVEINVQYGYRMKKTR